MDYKKSAISLPKDFDPLAKLQEMELLNNFLNKSGSSISRDVTTKTSQSIAKEQSVRRLVRDMQVIGCLIMELFLPKKFLSLGPKASLQLRYHTCQNILVNESHLIPSSIKATVQTLLLSNFQIETTDRYPSVDNRGLPPPSPMQLLLSQVRLNDNEY